MKKSKWFANILGALIVLCVSAFGNFLGTALMSEHIIVLQCIIGFIAYISVPILMGALMLKDTGKVADNYISLIIPTAVVWLVAALVLNAGIGGDDVGFTVLFMNAPGTFLAYRLPTHFTSSDVFITGFSVVVDSLLSSIGLLLRKHM